MTVRLSTLPGGLRVATDSVPGMETAAIGLWVAAGTRHEEPADNGVAHLVEHMLFKGTRRRSAFDISSQMDRVGGHLNAYTGREATAYHAQVLKEDLPLALDILADMLQNAVLDTAELDRERAVIVQEIGQSLDQPEDYLFDIVQEKAWPASGLGAPVLGRTEIIRSIPRERLTAYMASHYAAPQIILAAAGGVDHDTLVSLAGKQLGGLPRQARTCSAPARFSGGDLRVPREIEQLHSLILFPGLSYADPDYYPLSVFSTLLGGGMSSRLFQEVREKRGLAYSIHSFAAGFCDGGQFGVYAGTGPARAPELLPVIAGEMLGALEKLEEEELVRAQAQLRAALFMAQESSMARAERLASNLIMHGRIVDHAEVAQKIAAVQAEDIRRVARRLLSCPPVTGFVGPLDHVPEGGKIAGMFRV